MSSASTRYPPQSSKTEVDSKHVIVEAVRNGLSIKTAASLANISPPTLYNWLKIDPQFKEDLEQAKASIVHEYALMLKKSANAGNARAIEFFLKTHTEDWKEKPQITEGELNTLERIIGLMTINRLLPDKQDSALDVPWYEEPIQLPEADDKVDEDDKEEEPDQEG
jgi:hypothetical protein